MEKDDAGLNKVQASTGSSETSDDPAQRTWHLGREQRHLLLISVAAGFSLLAVAGSSLMFVNMVGKAMSGRASTSAQQAKDDLNKNLDKLLYLERTKTVRYLDPRRIDDHFFGNYFNSDLGITSLDLSDSHITDKSTVALPLQKNLHFLTLENTSVTDNGIANLRMFHDLLELHLDRTGLTDRGMKYLAEIRSLKNLSLRATAISDQGVKSIAALGLRDINVGGCAVSDESLKTLSAMKQLQHLNIRACRKISGDGLKYLAELPMLQYLDVQNCALSEAGIASIGSLQHLIALEFGFAKVTTSGIKVIANIKTLEYLSLNGATVDPQWMSILGTLPRLQSLCLNSCALDAGTIAAITEHLPNLTQLQLRFTPMTDEMVAPLAKLKDLQYLDMEGSGVSFREAHSLQRQLSRPGHEVQVRY